MKKLLLILIATLSLAGANIASANEGGFNWDKAPNNTTDLASLQRGAKLFVNYCLNCHSAAFMRYNRLKDIGISEQQIKENLLFTTDKVGDTMKANIDPKQAKAWFGANPPDLTVIARSRSSHSGSGGDYIYTYLRTYYRDPTKATGWNNLAYPNVAMPNVLWELQGTRHPVYTKQEVHGEEVEVFNGWEQDAPGQLSSTEYDQAVGDLVNYLQWMAEPAQNTRVRVGVWVVLFLLCFAVIAWRLNAAYWKDIR